MKRMICTICLLLLVSSCNYVGVLGGSGGEFDSTNFTLEFGGPENKPGKSGERDWLLVGGVTYINNKEGTQNKEFGGFGKLGLEVVPDTGFFVNALGGITFMKESSGYVTQHGSWQSTESETEVNGMFGGGVTYFISDDNFCIQANYDNRRGYTIGVGWRF